MGGPVKIKCLTIRTLDSVLLMTLTIPVIRENTTRIITVFSRIFDFSSIIVSGYFMHMEFAGSEHE